MSNRIGIIGAVSAMIGLSGGQTFAGHEPFTVRMEPNDTVTYRRPSGRRYIANLFAAPVTTSQRRARKNRRRAHAAGDKQAFASKH